MGDLGAPPACVPKRMSPGPNRHTLAAKHQRPPRLPQVLAALQDALQADCPCRTRCPRPTLKASPSHGGYHGSTVSQNTARHLFPDGLTE